MLRMSAVENYTGKIQVKGAMKEVDTVVMNFWDFDFVISVVTHRGQ